MGDGARRGRGWAAAPEFAIRARAEARRGLGAGMRRLLDLRAAGAQVEDKSVEDSTAEVCRHIDITAQDVVQQFIWPAVGLRLCVNQSINQC